MLVTCCANWFRLYCTPHTVIVIDAYRGSENSLTIGMIDSHWTGHHDNMVNIATL